MLNNNGIISHRTQKVGGSASQIKIPCNMFKSKKAP